MDLGSDYDWHWDWDCNWDWHWDWHMVLLLTVTKCGHVKVMGERGRRGSGIYSSSSVLDVGTSMCFGWSPEVFEWRSIAAISLANYQFDGCRKSRLIGLLTCVLPVLQHCNDDHCD